METPIGTLREGMGTSMGHRNPWGGDTHRDLEMGTSMGCGTHGVGTPIGTPREGMGTSMGHRDP